jgi:hypothetical protein
MKAEKLIISHRGNIEIKYGLKSRAVFTALNRLKTWGTKNGIKSEIIYLADTGCYDEILSC